MLLIFFFEDRRENRTAVVKTIGCEALRINRAKSSFECESRLNATVNVAADVFRNAAPRKTCIPTNTIALGDMLWGI